MQKISVKKYEGTGWVYVGQPGEVSEGMGYFVSLKIEDGIPYVAYSDLEHGGRATVMFYNGSEWKPAGIRGFTDTAVHKVSLSMDNRIPYIAYTEMGNDYKVSVMKYEDGNWEYVGYRGISDGGTADPSFFIYGGVPYVAYMDLSLIHI